MNAHLNRMEVFPITNTTLLFHGPKPFKAFWKYPISNSKEIVGP